MTLVAIAIFGLGAILYKFIPQRFRGLALLVSSIVAIYWLQPALSVRPLDFIFPTATIILGIVGWFLTRQEPGDEHENRMTLIAVIGSILSLALLGALFTAVNSSFNILPSPPPGIVDVVVMLAAIAICLIAFGTLFQDRQRVIPVFIFLILAIFVVLKAEPLTLAFSQWIRGQTNRPLYLAGLLDIQWLGFSYVSFRLIHTLRDWQNGKLPPLTLREYLTYLLFFPAYTAGPIDRAERFVKDYRNFAALDAPRTVEGLSRIVIGIFKKFIVADSLAIFALNTSTAVEAQSTGGLWILLYAYAFRLFLDFSGYSDIAIGLGILYGIKLPENFDRPYLKDNITTFWQSWHMTLSTWARNYVFTPLSRNLMTRPNKPSPTVIVLVTQIATMIAIGLWHGITLNFVLWGLWHGLGLWLHKLYTDRTRVFYQNLKERPRLNALAHWIGILLTFHFVALGWVWFALPTTELSLTVLRRLFGG